MKLRTFFINPQRLPIAVDASGLSSERLFEIVRNGQNDFSRLVLEHGALLIRGAATIGIDGFEEFVRAVSGRELFSYAGGVSPRIALGSGVYTSTEYPKRLSLALHNELSYSKFFPSNLYFYCVRTASWGGQTTIADSREILRAISPSVLDVFRRKGVEYVRYLLADEKGYCWQDAFETDSRAEVELLCRKLEANVQWTADDSLEMRQSGPATMMHPETGQETWFNQAHGFHPSGLDPETYEYFKSRKRRFRLNCRFGDGGEIPIGYLEHIRDVLDNAAIPCTWEKGDILILDNILIAHGRMPYEGDRQIAVSMT
jgi:hypothetical protein